MARFSRHGRHAARRATSCDLDQVYFLMHMHTYWLLSTGAFRRVTCFIPLNEGTLFCSAWRPSTDLPQSMATVAATAAAAYTIAINFSSTASPLRFSYGADGNSGPECGTHVSVAAELHSFGATLIRTHDADAIDWPLVFPHPKFDVPTDDPDSYDWTRADAYFHKLVDNGFEPYVRLGTSWGQQGGGGLPPAGVPYNRTALVDVLLHTVMHLNDGWGGGFTGKAVRHFEIWNEPDSSCAFHNISGCGRFWNRTAADFYALVDEAARVIKTYDPTLSVGTCGAANLAWPAHNPYGLALIAELGGRGTPLDFFSWHGYIDQPSWYAARAAEVRSALDAAFPGRNVAQHVTEFFPCVLYKEQDTAYGAAAFASTLTTFVHSGVRLATLYPLCAGGEGRTGGKGWGLFDQESVPGVATWRRLTHAFAAFGEPPIRSRGC